MGIVFRQSAKNLIVAVFGAILGTLVVWLSTRYISKQGFGFLNNLAVNSVILSQILLMGLNSTVVVYIFKYATDDKKRKLLLTICLCVPAIFAAIFTILYFAFRAQILHHFQAEDIPFMSQYFMWLPLSVLFFIYMTILEQYLGSQMKVAVSAFMREIVVRILNIILIVLFALGYITISTLIIGTVLIYIIPVIIFFILSFKTTGFGFSFNFNDLSPKEYKEIFHFAWYHFLLGMAMILMSLMDRQLIPIYDHNGLSALAVYTVAGTLISFLLLPSKAFINASFSALAKAFTEGDMPQARNIFNRASLNLLIPTMLIAVLLVCNLDNAISIIGKGKNYSEAANVFMILMAGSLVNVATGMNDQVLSIANYYKFNFYVSLFLIALFFGLMKYLVPRYGISGAAFSSSAVLIIFNIIKYVFVWKKLAMQPFSSGTLRVLLAAVPALIAGHFFPYLFDAGRHIYVHTFIDAAIRSAIIAIIYLLMLLWLKPSADLEEYIAAIKKNKRLY